MRGEDRGWKAREGKGSSSMVAKKEFIPPQSKLVSLREALQLSRLVRGFRDAKQGDSWQIAAGSV